MIDARGAVCCLQMKSIDGLLRLTERRVFSGEPDQEDRVRQGQANVKGAQKEVKETLSVGQSVERH